MSKNKKKAHRKTYVVKGKVRVNEIRSDLSVVLGKSLLMLARTTHGYPVTFEGSFDDGDITEVPYGGHPDAWKKDLTKHGKALLDWVAADSTEKPMDVDEYVKLTKKAEKAYRWVGDNLMDLWD